MHVGRMVSGRTGGCTLARSLEAARTSGARSSRTELRNRSRSARLKQEGIALAPDGRSLMTSVGMRRSAIWIHDAAGERALSSEGYGGAPRLSRMARASSTSLRAIGGCPAGWTAASSELRSVDLASGKTDSVLPGISVSDYDVSRDETEVAFTTTEAGGPSQIWLASLDRRAPPRLIAQGGDQVSFGADGDLIFRSLDETTNRLARIKKDGTGREPVTTTPILDKGAVSPDGEWVVDSLPASGEGGSRERGIYAIPVRGGAPSGSAQIAVQAGLPTDDSSMWHPPEVALHRKTLAIPLPAGRSLPDLPASGIDAAGGFGAEGSRVFGRSLRPSPSVYVFTKTDMQRNLFRVPLH